MLPTSKKVPDRFTPEGSETTYLIEVPDAIGRARYRRAMKAVGARIWPKFAMLASARAEIALAAPATAEEWLEICDRYEAMTDELTDAEKQDIVGAWLDLSRILQGAGGDFAARVADNEYWMELSPLMAARCFLIGTVDVALKRSADGMVPAETLESAITEEHIVPIGWRVMALFSPTEAEAKNSASPQPSSPGPATSTAANALPTVPAGNSSGNSSSETQS